jgi:hypothetical protein
MSHTCLYDILAALFWHSGIRGDTQTHGHRQQGGLLRLLLFFQNKEIRLKIKVLHFEKYKFEDLWNITVVSRRAIRKVISCELLKKQAMRKKNLLYTKNKYILKLLPIVVTA